MFLTWRAFGNSIYVNVVLLSLKSLCVPSSLASGASQIKPWAFSRFQVCDTDYPAISSVCLFDFLHRLKVIPNQTNFIDETTRPPGLWINKTWLVGGCVGERKGGGVQWHQSVLEKSPAFHNSRTALCFPIRDVQRNYLWQYKQRRVIRCHIVLPSFTYNIYPIDFFWLKI